MMIRPSRVLGATIVSCCLIAAPGRAAAGILQGMDMRVTGGASAGLPGSGGAGGHSFFGTIKGLQERIAKIDSHCRSNPTVAGCVNVGAVTGSWQADAQRLLAGAEAGQDARVASAIASLSAAVANFEAPLRIACNGAGGSDCATDPLGLGTLWVNYLSWRPKRNGYRITSAHDAHTNDRGSTTLGVGLYFWPWDRFEGDDAPSSSTWLTELAASHAVSDSVTLGIRAPFAISAETYDGGPERNTGLGNIGIGAKWWLTRSSHTEHSVWDVGADLGLSLPTASEPEDNEIPVGPGIGSLAGNLVLSIMPWKRSGYFTGHARVGRIQDLARGVDYDSTEMVFGALWRPMSKASSLDHDLAFSLDFAGTFFDESFDDILTETGKDPRESRVSSMWDARLGVSYLSWSRDANHNATESRTSFSLELARTLSDQGFGNSISVALFASRSF